MRLAQRFWNEETGFVISIELILIASVAVLGLIVGLSAVRDSVVSELSDVAGAVQDLNQSYSIAGVYGHSAGVSGSSFSDAKDFCDDEDDREGRADNCINFAGNPDSGESSGGSSIAVGGSAATTSSSNTNSIN